MRLAALAGVFAPLVLTACSSMVVISKPKPDPSPRPVGPVASLKIPPGHYPPPGKCRVWYPGQPPGHQPPATSCHTARGDRPAGAWVLYRPPNEKKVIEVTAYDGLKPKVVVWVRLYDAKTGEFLRAGKTN